MGGIWEKLKPNPWDTRLSAHEELNYKRTNYIRTRYTRYSPGMTCFLLHTSLVSPSLGGQIFGLFHGYRHTGIHCFALLVKVIGNWLEFAEFQSHTPNASRISLVPAGLTATPESHGTNTAGCVGTLSLKEKWEVSVFLSGQMYFPPWRL